MTMPASVIPTAQIANRIANRRLSAGRCDTAPVLRLAPNLVFRFAVGLGFALGLGLGLALGFAFAAQPDRAPRPAIPFLAAMAALRPSLYARFCCWANRAIAPRRAARCSVYLETISGERQPPATITSGRRKPAAVLSHAEQLERDLRRRRVRKKLRTTYDSLAEGDRPRYDVVG